MIRRMSFEMKNTIILITVFGLCEQVGFISAIASCGKDISADYCDPKVKDGSCWMNAAVMTMCMTSCNIPPECTGGTSKDTSFACRYNAAQCDTDPSYSNSTCITTCRLRKSIICDPLEVVIGAVPSNSQPRYLDIIEYSCIDGYIKRTSDNGRRICITNGTWVLDPVKGKAPVCERNTTEDTNFTCLFNASQCDTDIVYRETTCITTCSLRKDIKCDPLETVVGAVPSKREPKYLDVVEYSCTNGYTNRTNDKGRRTCVTNGTWSLDPETGRLPECKKTKNSTVPRHSTVNITLERVEKFVPHVTEGSNSVVFGVIAIIVFITVVGFIILLDSTTITRHVRIFFINIGRVIMRKNPERIEDC